MAPKNLCGKTVKLENAYETRVTPDREREWKVLKKRQADDDKQYARRFCGVKSPYTYGNYEYGDVYVSEIKQQAYKL